MTGAFSDEVNRTMLRQPDELTPDEVNGIVNMFAHGNAMVTVAVVYMVDVQTVMDIVNGRSHSEITGLTPRRSPYEST